jgi:hypothetical protein
VSGQAVNLGIGAWQHAGNNRMRYDNQQFHMRLRA